MTSALKRFNEKHEPVTEAGCWIWTASCLPKGYGWFYDGGTVLAHRWAYEYFIGPVPNEMCVCHKCDNPACVNPDHLFLGTQADNVADQVQKNRQVFGERNGNGKLTDEQVRAIRRSNGSQSEIAERFGIDRSLVSLIRSGKRWAHLSDFGAGTY